MNEQDKRNLETVRRMYLGDEAERASIAPNTVWHVPAIIGSPVIITDLPNTPSSQPRTN